MYAQGRVKAVICWLLDSFVTFIWGSIFNKIRQAQNLWWKQIQWDRNHLLSQQLGGGEVTRERKEKNKEGIETETEMKKRHSKIHCPAQNMLSCLRESFTWSLLAGCTSRVVLMGSLHRNNSCHLQLHTWLSSLGYLLPSPPLSFKTLSTLDWRRPSSRLRLPWLSDVED